MKANRRRELALAALALVGWLACFGLFVQQALRGGPYQSHFLVEAPRGPAGYPVVAGARPGHLLASASGVQPGDELLRIGAVDLRGAMPWTVYAHLYSEAREGAVEVAFVRDGRRGLSRERLGGEGDPWREATVTLSFAVTAFLILLRVPGSRMGVAFAWAALVWTLTWLRFQGPHVEQTYAYLAVRAVAGTLWAPLMLRAAFYFPEGSWPLDRRRPLWPWLFAGLGLTWTSKWMGIPFSHELGAVANPALGALVIATLLGITTRNYAHADAFGRRQVRWVLLGFYVGLTPVLLGDLVAVLQPDLAELWHASIAALVVIPVAVLIAVTRSNLFDVDRLISGAASYTIVLALLVASGFTVVPWIADRASLQAGLDPTLVQAGLATLLAFGFVRLEPVLRPLIERTFFAERQALQAGIDELVAELTRARDVTTLANLLGERLDALLRPDSCVIYARGDEAFAPVFARGSVVTPHFELESPLLSALAERASAVDVESCRGLLDRAGPGDRAALETLAAAVLVPIAREQELAAVLVLGRKRSGDIYTATDLALLGLVAASVSASIASIGGEALLRDARALQQRLREYVPASIAAQLVQGRSPEAGERAVSVLFADLRGYATIAEGRRAEEIFGVVARYTEAVTRAVATRGGTVVEFNGDGMMAVFGAPDPLPHKEGCALEAARQIVEEVGMLRGPGGDLGGGRLEVGVGLATGLAYVGPIPSADRYIWSAIGNTTNLAARLQALTKDFDAAIVIDEATHHAAGELARDFDSQPGTAIRGLCETRDLFSLPRSQLVESRLFLASAEPE